jgi:hypothetical protein
VSQIASDERSRVHGDAEVFCDLVELEEDIGNVVDKRVAAGRDHEVAGAVGALGLESVNCFECGRGDSPMSVEPRTLPTRSSSRRGSRNDALL